MNDHLRRPQLPLTTQAAEGLPRRRWTVAEIEAMLKAGLILEDERFELIGGEVVPMSPKGNQHEVLKGELQRYWFSRLPKDISLITETTLYISDDQFLEPDFLFWPRALALKDVTADQALLIVEVADSSLGYDLSRKMLLYATLGVREYWVIDAVKLNARVHRKVATHGYGEIIDIAPDTALTPPFAPGLAVVLADLPLN